MRIAFLEPLDFVDKQGNPLPLDEVPQHARLAVQIGERSRTQPMSSVSEKVEILAASSQPTSMTVATIEAGQYEKAGT